MSEAEKKSSAKGAGQKPSGRTANMPRIKPDVYAKLKALAYHRGKSIADTVEYAIAETAQRELPDTQVSP